MPNYCKGSILSLESSMMSIFKKSIVIILLSLIAVSVAFASDESDIRFNYAKASMLIKDSVTRNKDQIMEAVSSFDFTTKAVLYNQFKKDSALPFALNFILGFGIGSFLQSDFQGGLLGLCGELSSLTLIVTGNLLMNNASNSPHGISNITNTPLYWSGFAIKLVGFVSELAFRLWECVQPFTFADDFNRELSKAVFGENSDNSVTTGLAPVIDKDGNFGILYGASLKF